MNMKLGISSPLRHSNPVEWGKKHRELGLRAINFPLTFEDDERLISQYIKEAEKNHLTIAEVGVWRNTLSPDETEREKAIQYAAGQLRLADRIHARCCVNVVGARGPQWDGAYKENYTKETWNLAVKTIREIIDRAEPKNTYFTVEPMPWMIPTGPDEYLRLLNEVERDRFAVHMDIFNWMTTPKRYFFCEDFIDECMEKLGRFIRSFHLKDVLLEEDYTISLKETAVGQGGINVRYLLEKGSAIDKEMTFIIEHLDSDEQYLNRASYVKNLITKEEFR